MTIFEDMLQTHGLTPILAGLAEAACVEAELELRRHVEETTAAAEHRTFHLQRAKLWHRRCLALHDCLTKIEALAEAALNAGTNH